MTLHPALAGALAVVIGCAAPLAASAQTQPQQSQPQHGQQRSPQSPAMEGARTSGNIARGATDICNIDRAKVERFKAAAKANFTAAPDFEGAWQLGYTEAQSTVDRFAQLKAKNPDEYAKEIGEACPALDHGIDEVTQGK